jgi:hypothetical protein
MKTTHMMRLATFIIASLALVAAVVPMTQGQQVRPAVPLNGEERQLESFRAELRRLDAENEWVKREWMKLYSWPLSQQKIAAQDFLIARTNEISRGYEEAGARIAQFNRSQSMRPAPALTPPPSKNDCLIVATETYARLKKTAYWARIAGFAYSKGEPGHAVVLFQPTKSSTVWLYDAAGSRDLQTQSHNLSELAKAITGWLKTGEQVSDITWIGEDNTP